MAFRLPVRCVALILILSACAGIAKDKKLPRDVDTLLVMGKRLLDAENPDEAQKVFEAALKIEDGRIEALEGMASADVQRGRWGNAADWYEKMLERSPDNLAGHYGFAVCKRELGARPPSILRPREWRQSEEHFHRAMELDSTYRDVLYQFALLERGRGHFEDAVLLGHRQLAIEPETWSAKIGIFRLYDAVLNNRPFPDAEAWLKSRKTEHDRFFLAELLRRNDRLDEADSMFRGLLYDRDEFPLQPALLARVRIAVRKGENQRACDCYWEAVNGVRCDFDAEFVKQDLMSLVNGEEYQAFRGNSHWTLFPALVRAFWFRRNPMPSYPYNFRLVEHYRRLMVAETSYRFDGIRAPLSRDAYYSFVERGQTGRLQNDPLTQMQAEYGGMDMPKWVGEEDRFNDLGLIYIRYGEPDDQISAPGADVMDNVSWLYHAKDRLPKMIFHFTKSRPNGWMLIPTFSQPAILERMIDWDTRYFRLLNEESEPVDRISLLNQVIEERVQTVEQALSADRQTWSPQMQPIDAVLTQYRFRATGTTDFHQVAAAVPLGKLRESVGEADSVVLETGVEVFDTRLLPAFTDRHRFVLRDTSDSRVRNGQWIDEYQFELPLKPHLLAFHARVGGTEILNGWKRAVTPGDSARDRLAVSTLKLAYSIEPAAGSTGRDKSVLRMVPNPAATARLSDPLFLYYELYNLGLDAKGATDYTVQVSLEQRDASKNLLKRLGGLFGGGGGYRISIQNRQTGKTSTVSDYIGFDVRKASAGTYELKLRVTDRNTRQETASSTAVTLK